MNSTRDKHTGVALPRPRNAPSTDVAEVIMTAIGRLSLRKWGIILLYAECQKYVRLFFALNANRIHDAS
jgi:hypothetical protein